MRSIRRRDSSWDCIHTFGSEAGKSATEITTAIGLKAAAAREWGVELGIVNRSMDVKQAFDNVSPENLSLVMKDMGTAPVLAEAIMREQIGGKYDICFQEKDFWDALRQVHQTTREGESVLVQLDDEERLQDFARRMEGAADG